MFDFNALATWLNSVQERYLRLFDPPEKLDSASQLITINYNVWVVESEGFAPT